MAIFELNPTLVYSILAVLPPAGIFFAAYGRYDGAFRDNVVFLYFMAGILMGFLVGFLTALTLGGLTAPLIGAVLLAFLYPISLVVGINRRKWQGERHAVFNGGAFGIGVAMMMAFTVLYVLFNALPVTVSNAALALAFTAGITGLFFALGLLAGVGVYRRRPFRHALLGTAIALAPTIFLVSFVINVATPAPAGELGPWDAGTEGGEVLVGGFGGNLSYLVEVSAWEPANASLVVLLANSSGAYVLERADAPGSVAFGSLVEAEYRVEAWVDVDGDGVADAEEPRAALLDGQGVHRLGNVVSLVDGVPEGDRLEVRAPPEGGWRTRERVEVARDTPPDPVGSWLWALLLATYGLVVAFVAERRLLVEGVSDEARRMRRRQRRLRSGRV